MSTRPLIPVGPVKPAVTDRMLSVLRTAQDAMEQAMYEGSHTLRLDPEPVHGTPWTTPDLPADLMALLCAAYDQFVDTVESIDAAYHGQG